ncbi:RND transporter [Solibacillus silvestris]|nr:RND transporter [Solibacillus silvestris]OBW60676.1 RND transporter [Solibacillus silvestris]
MKNKNILITINWVTFTIMLLVGISTAVFTLYDLNTQIRFGEELQSRAGFRWGIMHIIILIVVLLSTSLLCFGWKRLFPFNVPIAIIIAGLCYLLFFFTFTIGWVGILGIFGFLIAFMVGVILIICYLVFKFLEVRKASQT